MTALTPHEYPTLTIDLAKITSNTRKVVDACASKTGQNIRVWGVTKGLSGNASVACAFLRGGASGICDSRMKNIAHMRASGVEGPFMLIRIPMLSEVPDLVSHADYSFISDLGTLKAIAECCTQMAREHRAVLALDTGDLREGFWPDELGNTITAIKEIRKDNPLLRVVGVGTNYACASGVLPDDANLAVLRDWSRALEELSGAPCEIVSVGGTVCLNSICESRIPEGVNMVRLGESLLLGTDTARQITFDWLEPALEIAAEIVELREKPSVPVGTIGAAAFGETPVFVDRGTRARAIVALGKQDIYSPDHLVPLDKGVHIVTASSDHLILDVADMRPAPCVGDVLRFAPRYPAMLQASTSPYVTIKLV